jgi:hypothetical protein
MKKLFANYNFDFDKNEKKLLINFCKQAFNSIVTKLNQSEGTIKFTKDEKIRLTHQLKQNSDYMKKEMKKSWFFKKWLYKSLFKQYDSLLEKHFKD